jgi:hypothetical protein
LLSERQRANKHAHDKHAHGKRAHDKHAHDKRGHGTRRWAAGDSPDLTNLIDLVVNLHPGHSAKSRG